MNRRATLAALLGKTVAPPKPSFLPPEGASLNPYTGDWTYEQAAHLLRRAMFAPTHAQIKVAVENGLAASVEQLFQDLPMPSPPINDFYQDDPFVSIGNSWVNAIYVKDQEEIWDYRHRSLRAWTMGLLLQEAVSIREKMTLFWHNHFAINSIEDPRYLYQYITLLRQNAWGNFKELTKAVTIDAAMLRFLNGNQNSKYAPNENYARELMELFTLGKGKQVGAGDYTTFTEQDVEAMARVLTGWRDKGHNSTDPNELMEVYFDQEEHDTDSKQLSHRFGSVTIQDMGDQEYAHLVDIIFQRPEVARFISRKLYRWFIYYKIDEATEAAVIEPMAQLLIESNFETKPVIQALLKSEHFYHILSLGPMIKNPVDFVVTAVKTFEVKLPEDLALEYNAWYNIFEQTRQLQMEYFDPPEVAGWKAYYQAPAFTRLWINATTLRRRMSCVDSFLATGIGAGEARIPIDVLQFVKTLDDPYDPNLVIEGFAKILFPRPLSNNQLTILKEILLPGLPDYEWGVEYGMYEADPEDMQLTIAIDTKLRHLLRTMMHMAEFYLS